MLVVVTTLAHTPVQTLTSHGDYNGLGHGFLITINMIWPLMSVDVAFFSILCSCLPRLCAEDTCKKCPGYDTVSRTCSRRGMCDDDVDARGRETAANSTGFKVLSATGTGRCTCSEPFSGDACEQGACPPGQRLDRDADVDLVSAKYPRWEACVPCQKGRFKNFSGNDDCRICTGGHIPAADATSCVACKSGTTPSTDRSECSPCDTGYVAIAGAPNCSSCPAGTAPNAEGSECIECHTGQYSRPGSKTIF